MKRGLLLILLAASCMTTIPRSVEPVVNVIDEAIRDHNGIAQLRALKLCRETLVNEADSVRKLQKENQELRAEIARLNKKVQADARTAGQWDGAKYLIYFVVALLLIALTIAIYIKGKTAGWRFLK